MKQGSRLNEGKPVVAIVGGGVSGALTAHYLRPLFAHASITVVDPHAAMGVWLAYSKPSNVLFNVGPGRQGTLLESIAVPEIREQAAGFAKFLIRSELQSAPAVAA
jgi:uncharacterized NAD(P)/FAD-binding protein YdhS